MTEEVEDRSSEEQLEIEGTEDEFSGSGKSKITYTRALLLEFTETEVCRKLPGDFDLLILSQLNGAVDRHWWEEDLARPFVEKNKRTSSVSSVFGASPSGRWGTGFPGEKWDRHLLMPSKKSHSQANCRTERSDIVSQQLRQESRYDAVVSDQKTPESALVGSFQLRKNGNPYRPPHLNKNLPQPSDTSPELGVESSESSSFSTVESDQRGSSDSITGNDKPVYVSPLASENEKPDTGIIDDNGVESSESFLFPTVESDKRGSSDSITENDKPVYVSPLASEMIDANDKPNSGIIDDNGLIYEDLWADILEKQLQEYEEASCRDNKASRTLGATDKLELGIIDDNQNTYEDYWADILESLRQQQEPELGPTSVPDAEVDICLPDEDSLISVDHFNMLDNRNDAAISETEIIWPDEDSLISVYEMKGPYSSVPADIGKPFLQLGNKNIMNFHAKSNYIPYRPSLNFFNFSNFFYPYCFPGTNPNHSLVHYSLSQQPYIYPMQQYHPPVDMMCRNPIKQVASQQTNYQGLGKSNAGAGALSGQRSFQ
ncbi:hypothetical protein CASFOL_003245 [Castilleja foliolosa]|uniref:Uncharacterized protein n=1 Tax=Castilleja foliolosa TaxID=1961234 RepID=A0ABD3EH39_9LAMI